jgi:hypothetical protein
MGFFSIAIEHTLCVPIKRPHDSDPGKHRRSAKGSDQDERFHGGLPFRSLMLGFGEL